ncbi:hypothetical protein B0T22DRAFT_291600 [Podospora appendiculata]|uniref:Uncharacterized protein n=1 Tax=Podospora appendiculata TaxID=314037 RepID=A0AAE1C8E3_9PEZI|nr:hypothetical protein B0T22DRAFT_291600 [Podospora appendiculata]
MSSRAPSSLRAGRKALEALSHPAGHAQRRYLSSTAPQSSSVVKFRTDNPELKELLTTLREKIILPFYLPPDQRQRVFNAKYKQKLLDDPITMEVDGEELRFGYIDPLHDLPDTKKLVTEAVGAMKTPTDFRNLPALLEGLRLAHRFVKDSVYQKMIRRAGMHGCIDVILDCVKQVKRTGLRLDNSQSINELLAFIQKEALASGWDKKETERALRRTQALVDMLEEEPLHWPTKNPKGKKVFRGFPFYRDPQILAARLHMAAAMAVKHQGGHDVDGKVAKYARELLGLWPTDKGLLELHPVEAYASDAEMRYLLNRNSFLWFASPVLNGLRLAAQVVEPALAQQLLVRAKNVEEQIETALADKDRVPGGRGEELYNELFGAQGSTAA